MNKWKVLVTPNEACEIIKTTPDFHNKGVEFIFTQGKVSDPQLLKDYLGSVDGAILDVENINNEILKSNARLRIISRFGVGYDSISLPAIKEKEISLAITYAVSAEAVARHALALFLASQCNLIEHKLNALNGRWLRMPNHSVNFSPIGIVGLGNIGNAFKLLVESLGYKTLVWKKNASEVQSLQELISKCKTISIHVPLNEATKNLFDQKQFDLMENHTLINTSRGGIVNEGALLSALNSEKLKSYATDVFSAEPFMDQSLEVAAHPKVICTPHLASFDRATAEAMTSRAFYNCLNYLEKNSSSINRLVQ